MQFCLPGKTPPCSAQGEYFVADQIFVKYKHNEFDKLIIEDILVIENKLNRNTLLTTPQKEALKKSSYIVRNIEPKKSQTNSKLLLNKNDKLNFENNIIKWYKVYDGEDGKIIKGIDKL